MNVLSLCSGIGGLDLGIRLAVPSARTVCYVEWEPYAACVLAARMASGDLEPCPVYCDDLGRFDGYAWGGGIVDLVAAGFPCQPFSSAGHKQGMADERWLWPEVWRITQECGARLLFLENVPPIVLRGATSVLADLADGGWAAEWDVFRAADVGAPHRRARWFCLARRRDEVADAESARLEGRRVRGWPTGDGESLADTEINGREIVATAEVEARDRSDAASGRGSDPVADSDRERLEGVSSGGVFNRERETLGDDADRRGWPPGPSDAEGWREWIAAGGPKPVLRGDAARLPGRLDRLRCLGNAVVPQQAALAWRTLSALL